MSSTALSLLKCGHLSRPVRWRCSPGWPTSNAVSGCKASDDLGLVSRQSKKDTVPENQNLIIVFDNYFLKGSLRTWSPNNSDFI